MFLYAIFQLYFIHKMKRFVLHLAFFAIRFQKVTRAAYDMATCTSFGKEMTAR